MLSIQKLQVGCKVGFYFYERKAVTPHEFYRLPAMRRKQQIEYGTIRMIIMDKYTRVIGYLVESDSGGDLILRTGEVFRVGRQNDVQKATE